MPENAAIENKAPQKNTYVCHHCKRLGHKIYNCRFLKREKKEKRKEQEQSRQEQELDQKKIMNETLTKIFNTVADLSTKLMMLLSQTSPSRNECFMIPKSPENQRDEHDDPQAVVAVVRTTQNHAPRETKPITNQRPSEGTESEDDQSATDLEAKPDQRKCSSKKSKSVIKKAPKEEESSSSGSSDPIQRLTDTMEPLKIDFAALKLFKPHGISIMNKIEKGKDPRLCLFIFNKSKNTYQSIFKENTPRIEKYRKKTQKRPQRLNPDEHNLFVEIEMDLRERERKEALQKKCKKR